MKPHMQDPELLDFLEQVARHPDDDQYRILAAERFMELDQEDRGRFIIVQMRIAAIKKELAAFFDSLSGAAAIAGKEHISHGAGLDYELRKLRVEQKELLEEHSAEWLRDECPSIGFWQMPAGSGVWFDRGFVNKVRTPYAWLGANAKTLFSQAPVTLVSCPDMVPEFHRGENAAIGQLSRDISCWLWIEGHPEQNIRAFGGGFVPPHIFGRSPDVFGTLTWLASFGFGIARDELRSQTRYRVVGYEKFEHSISAMSDAIVASVRSAIGLPRIEPRRSMSFELEAKEHGGKVGRLACSTYWDNQIANSGLGRRLGPMIASRANAERILSDPVTRMTLEDFELTLTPPESGFLINPVD